uniref:Uncharacterized protein n=2 Tax=Cacopsylla melanoneura TaxID=428564 RepID=A0A8D8QJB0_9HEMI
MRIFFNESIESLCVYNRFQMNTGTVKIANPCIAQFTIPATNWDEHLNAADGDWFIDNVGVLIYRGRGLRGQLVPGTIFGVLFHQFRQMRFLLQMKQESFDRSRKHIARLAPMYFRIVEVIVDAFFIRFYATFRHCTFVIFNRVQFCQNTLLGGMFAVSGVASCVFSTLRSEIDFFSLDVFRCQ